MAFQLARDIAVAALLAGLLSPVAAQAQPVAATVADPVMPLTAPPTTLAPSTEAVLAPPARTVSDWDLFAGSVYANTSPVWVQAQYLLWWLRGNEVPPLVTSSPPGTPRGEAGVLGEPGTRVLFGSERIDDRGRSGFRTALGVRLGHWFDALMDCELQADYLWIGDGQTSGDFSADSQHTAILARPFFNAELGHPDALLVSHPDVTAGALVFETASDFQAAGAAVRRSWLRGAYGRIEWLAGYRYLRLREALAGRSASMITELNGPVLPGTLQEISDRFETWNEFHGGDLGLEWWTETHGWTVELVTKVALGELSRIVSVTGETVTQAPDGTVTWQPGGLLALPTNQGRHRATCFTAVPELSLQARRQLTRHLVFTVGYSLLVVDRVVRTGDQLDLTINPSQRDGGPLVGVPRPAAPLRDSTLWLHGLTLGLEW